MGNKLTKHIEKVESTEIPVPMIPVWYWQSNKNCWSSDEVPTWTHYSDIESEILEEACQAGITNNVDLGPYRVDLGQNIQINRHDRSKQRKIKRALRTRDELIRESNRFSDPLTTAGPFNETSSAGGYHGFIKAWKARNENLSDDEILELAANGILLEAEKEKFPFHQAEHIAKKLRSVQGKEQKEISIMCLHLYTLESFLYKLINGVLRSNDQTKVDTLAPFCYLLFQTRYNKTLDEHQFRGIVYRGIDLDDQMLEKCRQSQGEWRVWYQFSSTSKNRSLAEKFGNTLFIINIKLVLGGLHIESYSKYANEEEVLLPAGAQIRIDDVAYDDEKKKHLVYVTAETRDPHCLALLNKQEPK